MARLNTIPTDDQLAAECREIVTNQIRYAWPRSLSEGRFSWGEWVDAAETALDCGDFSEYRWMRDLPDPDGYDTEAEARTAWAEHIADMRRDDRMIDEWERVA